MLLKYYGFLPISLRNKLRWLKKPYKSFLIFFVRSITKNKVQSGPFQNLSIKIDDFYAPMIFGTYEKDLHFHLEEWIKFKSDLICIGAAEGYYAAGFAIHRKNSNIFAYEQDDYQKNNLLQVCQQNHLNNIEVLGKCSTHSLDQLLKSLNKSVDIICDIEGGEIDVLDLNKVPLLKYACILVEVHDHLVPGCTDILKKRFEHSHKCIEILESNRCIDDFPRVSIALNFLLSTKQKLNFLNEGRVEKMKWLYFLNNSSI